MHSAWTSGARPSVACTLTLKWCSRVDQNAIFIQKIEKIGEGAQHPPQISHTAGGNTPPAPTPLGASALAPSELNPWPPCRNPKYATVT